MGLGELIRAIVDRFVGLQVQFYFSRVATDNPKTRVFELRSAMMDLLAGNAMEVTGATAEGECYVFYGGHQLDRYRLVRLYKNKVKEQAHFPYGWPANPDVRPGDAPIEPDSLIIQGRPFRLTVQKNELSQFVLSLEISPPATGSKHSDRLSSEGPPLEG
jgi:hypothetical protein